ncbi:helix-turn-helix domain-containing protein [Sorangium sp. So ce362]|uniref:helix-turn-helix domain-containing protein n=1 Tax=Sorangium sp. So ce362 TaxID=3133303 RepID=UPI003F63A3EB
MQRMNATAGPSKAGDIKANGPPRGKGGKDITARVLATLASPNGSAAGLLPMLLPALVTLVQAVVQEMQQGDAGEADPVLDAEGAGELLGISKEVAIRKARAGEIAASKLGSRLGWRFRRSDLLAYLEAKRRRPVARAANDAEGLPTDAAGVLAEMGLPAPRGRR